MARVKPLDLQDVPELAEVFRPAEERMGFVPNSMRTMARNPEIVKAFSALGKAIMKDAGAVPLSLKNMIGHVASLAGGCQYCQAHTANNAGRKGSDLEAEKIANIWAYETSPLFSEAERAALAFAQSAASTPNMTSDEQVDGLRAYFSDTDIVEITAVVSFYGFLNRWNDTMATELEETPRATGEALLKDAGWEIGEHAPMPAAGSEAAE